MSLLVVAARDQKWGVHGVYSLFLVEREGGGDREGDLIQFQLTALKSF